MSADPMIALGLRALAVAMKAKARMMTHGYRADLLRAVLLYAPEDAEWRDVVLLFDSMCHAEPEAAGAMLHDWLIARLQPVAEAAPRLEAALRVCAEFPAGVRVEGGGDV